jgi:hypothetical protein
VGAQAVRKKLLPSNPCWGAEFPVAVKGLFRPHYVSWSEQQGIEAAAPSHLRNVVRIITETGLRIYKELTPMKKGPSGSGEQGRLDSRFQDAERCWGSPVDGPGRRGNSGPDAPRGKQPVLFPRENAVGHETTFKTAWRATLRRAKVPYFRYDLRSTYATRLSAGGVADEWVTQLLRQGDAKVFKKDSQMKLQMKREALQRLNRAANESAGVLGQAG